MGDNMSESMGDYISESLGDFVGIGSRALECLSVFQCTHMLALLLVYVTRDDAF